LDFMKTLLSESWKIGLGMLAWATIWGGGLQAGTNDLPHFQEVMRVLRANLAGVSEEDLNRAAVTGLLNQFHPQVMLVTNGTAGVESLGKVSRTAVYDKSYGYIRVAEVGRGLADQIASALASLNQTNQLKGLVLDLRFAGGADYEAAARAADRFLTGDRLLLDWQGGTARSTVKADAIRIPVAVLVNKQTTAAAEALAAVLRETDAALLVGASTAGGATVFKEIALSEGRKLRVASGSVETGSGRKLSRDGVMPDIEVLIASGDEVVVFADPYAVGTGSASDPRSSGGTAAGSRPRRRINEAELVRLQREGQDLRDPTSVEDATATRPATPETVPVMRDPALARGLDLLKGIVIMGQVRQP